MASARAAVNVAFARWFPAAWAILWIGGAALQLLPGQAGPSALADQVGAMDGMDGIQGMEGMPGWLSRLDELAGAALSNAGRGPFIIALVAAMALVGVAPCASRPWRRGAAVLGAVLATGFWVVGQDVGELYSGRATDPNTGPLIVLMAVALAGTRHQDAAQAASQTMHKTAIDTKPPRPRSRMTNGDSVLESSDWSIR